ncbi:MAG: beta-N-acetylhexosaminidase, partial [Verrucomicrobiae bacterium]|nr:beta-N-acetylhexosaminidase [Verrucomicrobiae bacterium]
MKAFGCTIAVVVGAAVLNGQTGNSKSERPAIVPAPVRMEIRDGFFELTPRTVVVAGLGAKAEADQLAAAMRIPTGFPLLTGTASSDQPSIELRLDPSLENRLGLEGYLLSVGPGRVVIQAAGEAGLFYGGITFRQLFPAVIFAEERVTPVPGEGWRAPCVEIEDRPRFVWRGLLLDVARHFMPPEFIRRLVDLMALHKLNSLQLHLTDDQGWRLEVKSRPRLTEIGSVRRESPRKGDPGRGDGTRYGPFFYTQAEVRELVAYAAARHVTLVPEIEMPGHSLAALAAYPELSCRGGPFEVRTRWGIELDILCPGNDATLAFVQDVLGEVVDLFPSRFIHIGGDEAPRDRWKTCPKCRSRLSMEGLQTEAQLQMWFNRRIEEFLNRYGRRLIGWDEILEGGLTPGAA